MSFCQHLTIELIKIIPFLIIGGITVYIAYRQYRIEKSKHYSVHRNQVLEIYKQINTLVSKIITDKTIDDQYFFQFENNIVNRHTLFSDNLNSDISKLGSHILEYIQGIEDKKKKTVDLSRDKIFNASINILQAIIIEAKVI